MKADKIHNPCENNIWGDLGEDKYEKLSKVECPDNKWCPYTRNIGNRDITTLFPGKKQHEPKYCWKKKKNRPDNTCLGTKFCKNLDIKNSIFNDLKFKCPTATCNNGNCSCGTECFKHPKFKICVPFPSSSEEPDSSNEPSTR